MRPQVSLNFTTHLFIVLILALQLFQVVDVKNAAGNKNQATKSQKTAAAAPAAAPKAAGLNRQQKAAPLNNDKSGVGTNTGTKEAAAVPSPAATGAAGKKTGKKLAKESSDKPVEQSVKPEEKEPKEQAAATAKSATQSGRKGATEAADKKTEKSKHSASPHKTTKGVADKVIRKVMEKDKSEQVQQEHDAKIQVQATSAEQELVHDESEDSVKVSSDLDDAADSQDEFDQSVQNDTMEHTTYTLAHYNRSDEQCLLGCSPSGVPYAMIRNRPKLVVVHTQRGGNGHNNGASSFSKQKPYHTMSGVSYESIRNRPKFQFKEKSKDEKEASKLGKQKPYHTVSGIPYADIRQRLPLPESYFMRERAKLLGHKLENSARDSAVFEPIDSTGRRPVDETLYTDPVLLGQPSDFFEGPMRNRDYLRKTLHLNSKKQRLPKSMINTIVLRLKDIYHRTIKPLEALFKFEEMDISTMSEAVISAQPMVLFLGPWSTGKSTMINWFVGLPKSNQLYTGTQPTTSEFTVLMAGDHPRTVEGIVLAADTKQPFAGLEQFGTQFLEKFHGLEYPSQLLERVTLVDTPGIIENKHKMERGYPFNEVMQWFIDRSHLIVLVFDPTKLDVGSEFETIFSRLKGRESQVRLLLNKADSIPMQELMRVYGSLFWNLAPLMNSTESPRVYTGSCWWKAFQAVGANKQLFLDEEQSLLTDINDVIENQLHNKIGALRQHAIRVRTHALLVDRFLYIWNKNKENEKFQMEALLEHPEKYQIFKYVQHRANVSKYDLPEPSKYKEFFEEHPLSTFRTLESLCTLFIGCPLENLEVTIRSELPNLLNELNELIKEEPVPPSDHPLQNGTEFNNSTTKDANSTMESKAATNKHQVTKKH